MAEALYLGVPLSTLDCLRVVMQVLCRISRLLGDHARMRSGCSSVTAQATRRGRIGNSATGWRSAGVFGRHVLRNVLRPQGEGSRTERAG